MSRWKNALAGAAGAVANVGVQAIDNQIKLEQTLAAEQRAADMKLDMAERLAAAAEMRRNAAAERFTNVVQAKLGEAVPLEAQTVDETGITRESARELGMVDGIAGDTQRIAGIQQQMQAVLDNPNATPEQKEDAAGVLAQLERQRTAQGGLNAKAVEGKTRTRSAREARDAALEETSATDLPAFTAGRSAWKDALADERADKKDAASAREKQLDRESAERRTEMGVEQRAASSAAETARKTEADRQRAEAARARTEALAGGKGAKATALMQNYTFLTEQLGKTPADAEKVLFQAKDSSEAEKVFKLLMADKYGDLTVDSAFEKVRGISEKAGSAGTKPRLKFNLATGDLE